MRAIGLRWVTFSLLSSAVACANAVVLDFSTLNGDDHSGYTEFSSTILANGFTLTTTGNFARWTDGTAYGSNIPTVNGVKTNPNAILDEYRYDTITLTETNGGHFNLVSMQIANAFTQAGTPFAVAGDPSSTISTIDFMGAGAGGYTTNSSYTTTHDDAFHTVSLNLNNVTSVTWTQAGHAFHQFDKVNVVPLATPEPSAIAALGLGGFALLRRRRRS